MRPSVSSPTGTENWCTGIEDFLAANQTFGGVHCNRAHRVLAQVLRHFQNQPVAQIVGFQRVQDRRQVILEGDVDHGADNLCYRALDARCVDCGGSCLSHVITLLIELLERFRARNDFDQFFGDLRLTLAVVVERQFVDHVACIARRVVHCGHARALL